MTNATCHLEMFFSISFVKHEELSPYVHEKAGLTQKSALHARNTSVKFSVNGTIASISFTDCR